MKFHVVTLFPEMVRTGSEIGLVGQAIAKGQLSLTVINPREVTDDVHGSVDDRPFGGGDGMVFRPEILEKTLLKLKSNINPGANVRVIHLSPRGTRLDDKKVRELASYDELVIFSSRYAGVDQRFINAYIDEEISLGDFVMTGGEIAALAIIDAVGRLSPGVVGNEHSIVDESFAGTHGILEYPQFTRPREWNGRSVPAKLLSGDHKQVENFKTGLKVLITLQNRPDLAGHISWPQIQLAEEVLEELSDEELAACGLKSRSYIHEQLQADLDEI